MSPASARVGVVVAVLAVAHLSVRVGLGVGGAAAPDLFALAVLFAGRSMLTRHAAVVGFGLGLLQDGFVPQAFGASPAALTLVAATASWTRQVFVGDSATFLASYFFLGKWVLELFYWLILGEHDWAAFADRVLIAGPVAALYAAGVGLALHWLFLRSPKAP